VAQAVIVGT